jgi:hypothetical protein
MAEAKSYREGGKKWRWLSVNNNQRQAKGAIQGLLRKIKSFRPLNISDSIFFNNTKGAGCTC